MKINVIKYSGGILSPASDLDAEELTQLKTGELFEVQIKRFRNPAFHRKVFAFLNFCFAHWQGEREFLDERAQFEVFRSHLTVLAGYYDSFYNIKGEVRVEAKSISFGAMSEQEFREYYSALIRAAMRHIFKTNDEATLNRLHAFF